MEQIFELFPVLYPVTPERSVRRTALMGADGYFEMEEMKNPFPHLLPFFEASILRQLYVPSALLPLSVAFPRLPPTGQM